MIIALVFLLGIVNFTLHSAALDSGHPMMSRFPGATGPGEKPAGLRITLLLEFAILLAAMWLSANGWPAVVLGYAFYSALNGVSAWAILTGKV